MTVRIGEMSAEFANANVTFVAIGMTVNNAASAANSMLLNFNVNDNSVFSISKTGKTTINSNVGNDTELMKIKNNNTEVVKLTSNVAKMNATTYIKSYSEGYKVLSGSSLNLDLSKASVFGTTSTTINSITFSVPAVDPTETHVFSCSLVLFNGATFGGSVWSNAGVQWSLGTIPTGLVGTTILTFMNVSSAPGIWYGVISGRNYA